MNLRKKYAKSIILDDKVEWHALSQNDSAQYAQQESNEVERYSKTEIAASFYDP